MLHCRSVASSKASQTASSDQMGWVGTHLEQSRDGKRSNATVVVIDELLHVEVARLHGHRLRLSQRGQSADGGELKS